MWTPRDPEPWDAQAAKINKDLGPIDTSGSRRAVQRALDARKTATSLLHDHLRKVATTSAGSTNVQFMSDTSQIWWTRKQARELYVPEGLQKF
jgi:hypothetical protein